LKNILLLTQYTLREALAKKIFIIFFIVSSLVITGFILFFSFFDFSKMLSIRAADGISTDKIFEQLIVSFKIGTISPLYAGALFLSIFSTAGIISSLLEKGNIDLFLSKPVSRLQLLMGKFLGGLAIVFINVAYVIISLWILIGVRFSVWDAQFLFAIPAITFGFAVIFSLVILFTIMSRSSVLPLILSYLIFFIVSPILSKRDEIYQMTGKKVLKVIMDGLHYIVPQTSELGQFAAIISIGSEIRNYEPVITSTILLVLMLGLAITIFNKKDY